MNFLGLFSLLICHFVVGRGLIALFKLRMRPIYTFCVSMICGVALASFVPFLLELFHVDITATSVGSALAVLSVIFLVPLLLDMKNLKMPQINDIKVPAIYELPFYIIFGFLMFLSVWRCYYYPSNARDMLSGPEVMAELAIKEKHIINSLFTVDLYSTNNYLKPPYITSLQVIYKLFVQPTGQLWLSVLVVNFLIMIFTIMKEKLHPAIAYFIMLFFFSMPEVFGYTYLMLFDYSNMIFFFLGLYFITRHLITGEANNFYFAAFLFAIATYVRTETLILVGMVLPLLLFYYIKEKVPTTKIAIRTAILLVAPFIIYYLCMNIWVKHYIPIKYDVSSDVNKNLGNVGAFFSRLYDIQDKLIFSENGVAYYGYFIYLFLIILAVDIAFFRKFNKEAIVALYAVVMVYVGLAFIGYLLPLADLMHTTKRGMFKIFPPMLFYMCNSAFLMKVSDMIRNWEYSLPTDKPQRPQAPRPVQAAPKKVK